MNYNLFIAQNCSAVPWK